MILQSGTTRTPCACSANASWRCAAKRSYRGKHLCAHALSPCLCSLRNARRQLSSSPAPAQLIDMREVSRRGWLVFRTTVKSRRAAGLR